MLPRNPKNFAEKPYVVGVPESAENFYYYGAYGQVKSTKIAALEFSEKYQDGYQYFFNRKANQTTKKSLSRGKKQSSQSLFHSKREPPGVRVARGSEE